MTANLLNNRYRIVKVLGSGGFGETFLAEDTQMPSQRRCVIKQLKPIANDPLVYHLVKERFQREAAVLEKLGEEHRQIPRLYAQFNENGLFYLVQEWIDGLTLAEKVFQEGLFDEATAREVLVKVLVVLDFVHAQGIIHRDIKPDNIILRHRDRQPILIDYGSVKETVGTVINQQGQTTTSIVIGTPGFMPTEQAAGRPVFASDIYSLAMTIIYALTGKIPRELPTDLETGRVMWQGYTQNLSPEFIAILDKATQVYSRDRYVNAREMLDDLQPGWRSGLHGSGISNIGKSAQHLQPPPNIQNMQSINGAAANLASSATPGRKPGHGKSSKMSKIGSQSVSTNRRSQANQPDSTTTPASSLGTNNSIATRWQQHTPPPGMVSSEQPQPTKHRDRQVVLLTSIITGGVASLIVVLGLLALNSRFIAKNKPGLPTTAPSVNQDPLTQNPNPATTKPPETIPTAEQPASPSPQPIDRELAEELAKRAQLSQACKARNGRVTSPQTPLNVYKLPSSSALVTAQLVDGTPIAVVSAQDGWLEINDPVNGWIAQSATDINCDRQVEVIKFAPNQNSTRITSSFEAPGSHTYIARANAGQVLVVRRIQGSLPTIKDPNGNLVTATNPNGDRAAVRLATSGLYTLEFTSAEADYIYEFSLQIE
jgi:serine/threonine protein kinase